MNQVYIVSTTETKKEPRKLVVRMYGGNHVSETRHTMKPLSVTEELVLVTELARRGLSPKVYGFWEEGRIEEFIESRQMTEEESRDPFYETDFAKNLGRFHAVDNVPLPKPSYDFGEVLMGHCRAGKDHLKILLQKSECSSIHDLLSHDWEKEIEELAPLCNINRHRMVLMHCDTHLQNIGILNDANEHSDTIKMLDDNNKNSRLKTFIYDYEFSSYNMRGKDIGTFLASKTGLIGTNDMKIQKEPCVFPEKKDYELFIREYQKECRVHFSDWDEEGKDSLDHIVMESIVGLMVASLWYMFAGINAEEIFTQVNIEWFNGILKRLSDCFFSCKQRLKTSYPDIDQVL